VTTKTSFALLLSAMFCTSTLSFAVERKEAQIVFKIERKDWRNKIERDIRALSLQGVTVDHVEQRAAEALEKLFDDKYGFIDFVTSHSDKNQTAPNESNAATSETGQAATQQPPVKLVISLTAKKVDPGVQFIPTDFVLTVHGLPREEPVATMWLQFRSAEESHKSVSYSKIVDDIRQSMETRLGTASVSDNCVKELLTRIPLANELHIVRQDGDSIAVLPWSCHEIQVAKNSHFTVKTKRPGIGIERKHFTKVVGPVTEKLRGQLSPPYAQGLMLMDHPGSAEDEEHFPLHEIRIPPNPVSIEGLHITSYLPGCLVPQSDRGSQFRDDQDEGGVDHE
jgi:hypothetical protein